ncbi:sensor histidine kinase [Kitasatospora atroaurantiaca]|uniref:histidine kinase n=2 Tax=Kitasatospora atroaurantiaca TaxID=285545 RepID=A0A561EI16_9ACTN|nr:histidine kinase [Kitasatospora atroaurantiaca]TWE15232.1 signal transduction histidine kinase [Kitasatospora atroaurantiaca]
MPRLPLLRRISPGAWIAVTRCVAGLFALVLFTAMNVFFYLSPDRFLRWGLWAGAGVAVVMALPIGVARRRPLPVLGLMLADSIAVMVLRERTWPLFPAMDVLICYIAATRSRRTGIAAAGTVLAVWAGAFMGNWVTVRRGNEMVSDLLSEVSGAALTVVIAWMIGNSIRQRRDYREALHAEAAARAVVAERLRIARELHDMVAHSIGVIAIQAGAAGLVIDTQPAGARKALSAIETTSRETLAGLRRMLGALHQAEADPAKAAPAAGLEAVDRLAATTADAGVRVEVHWLGQRRPLPPEIDLVAFRIIQESVTNTVRHSGTHHCQVSVEYRDEELAIEVVDDGRGPVRADAAAGAGYGISGMRERVALLNGRFSAGSRPEGGFRVAARLPT